MSKLTIGIIVAAVLVVWIDIKNRRERPIFKQIEELYAELLAGRFAKDQMNRRRFMRALAHYAAGTKGSRMSYALAKSTMDRCAAQGDKVACMILCALCLEDMGQLMEAVNVLDTVCGLEPEFVLAKEKRAHVLALMGDPAALDAYEEVVACCPDNSVYLNNYASALIRLNQNRKAIEQLEILLARDSEFANAYTLMAVAYARLKDASQMEKALVAAEALGEDVQRLRAMLKEELNQE